MANKRKWTGENRHEGRSKASLRNDKLHYALPPGKRKAESGRIYWESRPNRTDDLGEHIDYYNLNKKKKIRI